MSTGVSCVLYEDSEQSLSIAVNRGNAAELLDVVAGDPITVEFARGGLTPGPRRGVISLRERSSRSGSTVPEAAHLRGRSRLRGTLGAAAR